MWVDSIIGFRRHNPLVTDWKSRLFILNTWLISLNFWMLFSWLKLAGLDLPLIQIELLEWRGGNSLLAYCVQFVLVFVIINYVFIFRNARYKMLIKRYPNKNGRIALVYALITAALTLITGVALFLYG